MKNNNHNFKTSHFKSYFKANFQLMLKQLIEYKTNLYSYLFMMLIFTISSFIMVFLLHNSIGDVIGWQYYDYLLLASILYFIYAIGGLFFWDKNLSHMLLSGKFNFYLNKPGNIFFNYLLSYISEWAFLSLLVKGILSIGIILFFQIKIHNLNLVILSLITITLFIISLMSFFESLAFFMKKSNEITQPFWAVEWNFYNYPAPFMKKYYSKLILFIFPSFLGGSLIIPLIRNYEVYNIELQFLIIIITTIILSIITIINWKIGLEKYEAFG